MQYTFSLRARCALWPLSLLLAFAHQLAFADSVAQAESTVYDSDPRHLWNRLNATLFLRTADGVKKYGLGQLDILYWHRTKHLLVDPSRQQALSILDEFITGHGEKLTRDPLKHALLQRDLWQLFDWSARSSGYSDDASARLQLQTRLAAAIRLLALTTNEITALPNNYTQAEKDLALASLPGDLFQTNGPWVNVAVQGAELAAKAHLNSFGGRSVFLVMLHHPDGRQAAVDYLGRLRSFRPMWIDTTNSDSSRHEPELNPDLPQFPTNTQWALVRRMCVIDTEGRIQPTHVVESIQTRKYLTIPESRRPTLASFQMLADALRFNEFRMSRGTGVPLVAVPSGEKDFTHFQSKGFDPFDPDEQHKWDPELYKSEVLQTCAICHAGAGPGILSVNTFSRFFSVEPMFQTTQLVDQNPEREAEATIDWKHQQFDWGLLQGIWGKTETPSR